MIFKRASLLSGFILILILNSCAVSPPKKPNDICSIFLEKRSWYKAAIKSSKRWKIPLEVNMAFILQESSYIQEQNPKEQNYWVSFHGKEKVLLLGMPKLLMEHGKDIKRS